MHGGGRVGGDGRPGRDRYVFGNTRDGGGMRWWNGVVAVVSRRVWLGESEGSGVRTRRRRRRVMELVERRREVMTVRLAIINVESRCR